MAWGREDKPSDAALLSDLRRVRDVIEPPMTTGQRGEVLRTLDDLIRRLERGG